LQVKVKVKANSRDAVEVKGQRQDEEGAKGRVG